MVTEQEITCSKEYIDEAFKPVPWAIVYACQIPGALTGRDTPQARPKAALEGTNTYGTFCIKS